MQIVTNQFQKEIKSHGDYAFPLLVSYERLSRYESGFFMWHWHPEIELTLITKGQMIYKINQHIFHLKEGNILFGNTNTLHAGSAEPGVRDCRYTSITFDPRLVYGFPHSSISRKYVEPVTQNFSMDAILIDNTVQWHSEFASCVRNIIRIDRERPDCYELEISMQLQNIWRLLYLNRSDSSAISSHDQISYNRIKEILAYLEQHYMEKISLEDIAGHIHLCESECSRLFKRYMNVSLFSFLQEYRIERSLKYLADPTCSITDAAALSGFSDSNYYSKIFVRLRGCSPREYRKRMG